MRSTGIVRKVDELGRIVVPIETRRGLGVAEKDSLEIFVDGNSIILKKYQPACIFYGVSGTPDGREGRAVPFILSLRGLQLLLQQPPSKGRSGALSPVRAHSEKCSRMLLFSRLYKPTLSKSRTSLPVLKLPPKPKST